METSTASKWTKWLERIDEYTYGALKHLLTHLHKQSPSLKAESFLRKHGKKVCYVEVVMSRPTNSRGCYGSTRTFQGSGVIVQDDLVLTNAHLFFSPRSNCGKNEDDWTMNITVSMSPSSREAIPAVIAAWAVDTDVSKPVPVETTCDLSQDIAVIHLERPLPSQQHIPIFPRRRRYASIRHQSIAVIGISGPPSTSHLRRYPKRASTYIQPLDAESQDGNERAEEIHPMHKSVSIGKTSRYVTSAADVHQKAGRRKRLVRSREGEMLVYDVGTMEGQSGGLVIRGGRVVGIHRSTLEEEEAEDAMADGDRSAGRTANAGIALDGGAVAAWLRKELVPRIRDARSRKAWTSVVGKVSDS